MGTAVFPRRRVLTGWLLILLATTNGIAQDCLLPAANVSIPVADTTNIRLDNSTQAIITSYQLQCCGQITEWQAAVERSGGGHDTGVYTIHFQVWRPSPTVESDGCYSLVGENRFTSITLTNRLVIETPEATNISVQPGDVLGYFSIANPENDQDDNGIQLFDEIFTNEEVWYETSTDTSILAREGDCPLPVGSEAGRILSSSTSHGPILSANIERSDCPPLSSSPAAPTTTTIPTSLATDVTTTTSPSPNPPPTSPGLIAGLVVLGLVLAISAMVIICVGVLIYKKKKKKGVKKSITNPNYFDTQVKFKKDKTEVAEHASTTASSNPTSHHQNSDTEHYYSTTDVVIGMKKGKSAKPPPMKEDGPAYSHLNESLVDNQYSALQRPVKELPGLVQSDQHYLLGSEYSEPNAMEDEEDALYEPLFAQSYNVEESPVFGTAGGVVPSQGDRKTGSGFYNGPMRTYSKLNFFMDEQIYWAPATTTSEIYDQLASKNYREIPRSQLTVLEDLGSGQFGAVSKGLWSVSSNSIVVAIKKLHPNSSTNERVKLLREAAIIGQFSHHNVIKLYGLVTTQDPLMVCIQFMKNGDLRSFIQSMDVRKEVSAEIKDARIFFIKASKEIAAGMTYLSQKSFIHRDLAARNVLVSESFVCKIGDFEMARDLMDDTYYTSQGGSKIPVKWTAPEALLYKKYSSDSDVYSYGMVLFEIWSVGKKPFANMSNQEVLRITQKGILQSPPPGCPKAFYKLMVDCWNPYHQYRPKFIEICNYLQQPVSKLLYWSPSDSASLPEAEVLGGPLKDGLRLYTELQNKYTRSPHFV